MAKPKARRIDLTPNDILLFHQTGVMKVEREILGTTYHFDGDVKEDFLRRIHNGEMITVTKTYLKVTRIKEVRQSA